jgi:hypothetical protein
MDTNEADSRRVGLVVVLVLALFSALFSGAVLYISNLWTAVTETVEQELVSPRGRHKAVLSYRVGPDYSYQRVLLERTTTHWRRKPTEVAEVFENGRVWIEWRDARTLVVRCSLTNEEELIVRTQQWNGVRIKYQRE